LRGDFVGIVEATEYKGRFRQGALCTRRPMIGNGSFAVIRLVAVRKPYDLFAVISEMIFRNDGWVGDDVVHAIGAHCPRIAEIVAVNRRTASREDARACILRVAVKIDEDVDLGFIHMASDPIVGELPGINKILEGRFYASAHLGRIVRPYRYCRYFEL